MPGQGAHELELARELSLRDIALSALICAHRAVRALDEGSGVRGAGHQAWELLLLMEYRIGPNQARLSSSCYGLPRQLVGDDRAGSGGLGGFIFRIRQCLDQSESAFDVAEAWLQLCIDREISISQLEDLSEFHRALLGLQPPAAEDIEVELRRRNRRFDIPLTLPEGGGVVLSATVSFDRQRRDPLVAEPDTAYSVGTPTGTKVAHHDFVDGVRSGLSAAKTLLSSYGLGILAADIDAAQITVGALPLVGTPLTMGSAALPTALSALEMATQTAQDSDLRLPRPMRRLSSTGLINDGRLEAMHVGLTEKAEAVRIEGLSEALLAFTTSSEIPGVERISPGLDSATLEQAAEAWWGLEVWDTWRDRAQSAGVRNHGLIRLKPENFRDVIDFEKHVVSSLESELTRRILEDVGRSSCRAWVVTGRPQSGKTHVAFGLRAALAEAGTDLTVSILSADRSTSMDAESLRSAWQIVTHGRPTAPAVLILDDVEWLDENEDLGDVLDDFSQSSAATVIAFVRSDVTTLRLKGQVEDLDTLDTAPNADFMRKFAEDAAEQYEALRAPANLLGSIVKYAGPELYLLMRLLESATKVPLDREWNANELSQRIDHVSDEFARSMTGLSDRQRETLARIAALTVLNVNTPQGIVHPDDDRALALYLTTGPSGVKIPSAAAARAIVNQFPRIARSPHPGVVRTARYGDDPIRTLVVSAVRELLQRDPGRVPHVLESIVNNDPTLGPRVMEILARELVVAAQSWAGRPALVARVLGLVERYVSESERGALAETLARDLLVISPESLTPRELAVSLRIIDQQGGYLDRRKSQRHPHGLLKSILETYSGNQLNRVLRNGERPGDRSQLLRVLRVLYESRFVEIVEKSAEDFISCPQPWTARDLWSVLGIFREFERARPHGHRFEPLSLPIVQKMLERPPGPDLRSYLAWLALKISCLNRNELEPLLDSTTREIDLRLRGDVLTLVEALVNIRGIDRNVAHRVLNGLMTGSALEERVRSRLSSLSTMEAWRVVSSLSLLNGVFAWKVLCRDGRPREELVSDLVSEIRRHPDARGLSKLLSALSELDERFCPGSTGFGNALSESVGLSLIRAMMDMTRGRVAFHLVRALLDVRASYLDQVVDQALEWIDSAIVSNGEEYAPQLLVRMCTDPKLNESRDLCSEAAALPGVAGNLLNRMLNCADEVALRFFHSLGGLLEPELGLAKPFATRFLAQDSTYLNLLRRDRPLVVLRAAAAVSSTLQRAGVSSPGKEACDKAVALLEQDGSLENGRLRSHDLTEALRLMARMDDEGASEFVGRNRALLRRAYAQLAPRLPVCDLISTVSGLDRELARDLVTAADADLTRRLTKRLAYEPEPRTQAIALRHLNDSVPGVIQDHQWRTMVGDWLPEMPELRQPVMIADRLRLLTSWDRRQAQEAARRVDWNSVCSRVVYGQAGDLQAVAALASCAEALGLSDRARDLLSAATKPTAGLHALEPNFAARLLGTANALAPDIGRRMANIMIDSFTRHAATRRVIEPHRYLLGLGWYARHLQVALLEAPRVDGPLPVTDATLAPLVLLWGHVWLRPEPWRRKIVEEALADALATIDDPPRRPWAAATALIGLCLTEDRRGLDIGAWAQVLVEAATKAHPGLVSILVELAPAVRPVQEQLERFHDRLVESLEAPQWASEVMARQLLLRLG